MNSSFGGSKVTLSSGRNHLGNSLNKNVFIKKDEIVPLEATWTDLEGIMLSQAEKDKYHTIPFLSRI